MITQILSISSFPINFCFSEKNTSVFLISLFLKDLCLFMSCYEIILSKYRH